MTFWTQTLLRLIIRSGPGEEMTIDGRQDLAG